MANDEMVRTLDDLLCRAAEEGDYWAFRAALAMYEHWLRRCINARVLRYGMEGVLHRNRPLDQMVEEVCLAAFDTYAQRPRALPVSAWLEELAAQCVGDLAKVPPERLTASTK